MAVLWLLWLPLLLGTKVETILTATVYYACSLMYISVTVARARKLDCKLHTSYQNEKKKAKNQTHKRREIKTSSIKDYTKYSFFPS
jgi:hypothetical protein